jgi:hypothetical protein
VDFLQDSDMRRLFSAVFCLLPAMVSAQSQEDFHPENKSWNGLSRFVQVIESEGYKVVIEKRLSWDTIPSTDVPLFFHPLRKEGPAPSPSSVANFLRKGGRVLIADDFGAALVTFEALGLTRTEALPPKLDAYGDNPSLPFAEPVPGHSLGSGVDLLLTNHPAVFHSALTPAFVLGRAPDQTSPNKELFEVVVEGGLEEGRIIAVSDPSIFINNMMTYPGNETFAKNLLRHLAGPPPGRGVFHLYVGEFSEYGNGDDPTPSGIPGANEVQDFLRAFNEWLGSLSEMAPRGPLSKFTAALLALSGLLILLSRLSQQAMRYDGRWLGDNEKLSRAVVPRVDLMGLSEEDVLGAAFQVEMEEFLARVETPLWKSRPNDKRFEDQVLSLLKEIRALPPRAKSHQIAKLYRDWIALLQAVNLHEEWQRRARG